jgi:conjugative transfer signal peptidase TraF
LQEKGNAKMRIKFQPKMALLVCGVVIFAVAGVAAFGATGLRINDSVSFPRGIYRLTDATPRKDDLVIFAVPDTPLFAEALRRHYLKRSLFGRPSFLLKRLAAVVGDRVSIDARGVFVNGKLLPLSKPRARDAAGRPMPEVNLRDYILRPGEILLMSDYSDWSFDARYFGVQKRAGIVGQAQPFLLFDD